MELKGIPRAIWTPLRKWATCPLSWRNPLTWWKVLPALWAKMPGWVWIVLGAIVAVLLVRWGYRFPWTGFGEDLRAKTDYLEYRPTKTLWDWLGLLVVP